MSCGNGGESGVLACINKCTESASSAERKAAEALFSCLGNTCPSLVDSSSFFRYMECGLDNCASEMEQCFTFGTGSCEDAVACVSSTCGPGSTADCLFRCQQPASVEANKRLMHLLICLDERCGDMPVNACAQSVCIAESSGCLFDSPK